MKGWVGLVGWWRTEMVYPSRDGHHPGTNRVWRSATTLFEANALPLSQTANQWPNDLWPSYLTIWPQTYSTRTNTTGDCLTVWSKCSQSLPSRLKQTVTIEERSNNVYKRYFAVAAGIRLSDFTVILVAFVVVDAEFGKDAEKSYGNGAEFGQFGIEHA